ncbi:hypothetical protein GDO81_026417 [Engystomops pustulosus]|uniref:Contactin 4 n=1 Tax=Engystomops pustulosus TaxID=76066 RepID=A0AAV6Z5U5_ENGPU|nr:hypothetical protein GDO81_026417 [Engystomops pustulosus]
MGEYEPKIEVHFPESVSAAKGSTVKLECFALGNPVPTITWRRADGKAISRKVRRHRSSGVLEIPNFQQEDAGPYECVAENTRGKNMVRGQLTYFAPPAWVQKINDAHIAIEENILLECKASGRPKPTYTWLKNGQHLQSKPVPEEFQNGGGFGYVVAFRPFGTISWMQTVVASADSSRYIYRNESLPSFSPYEVKVGVFNNRGEGPFSPLTVVYTAEEEPGRAPAGVFARSLTAWDIEVSWIGVPGTLSKGRIQGYEVRYWKQNEKEQSARKLRTLGNQTSTKLSHLQGHTLYYLNVRAYNSAGTGPASTTINVTTRKPPPSQPPGNITWNSSNSKIILNWDQVTAQEDESEVKGYRVFYRWNRQGGAALIETNQTSVELSLPYDEDYIIEIRPISDGGEGSSSEPIRIPRISNAYAQGSGASTSNACTLSAISTLMISLTARSSL